MNTVYWRNKVMEDMYQAASGNEFYIGLSSSTPTAAGANVTEPTGNGYARVRVASFTQASDGSIENTNAVVFPTSTGTWFPESRLATHWVMFDGSGANAHLLSSGTLEEPIGIWKNTTVTIPSGRVVITLTDAESV